MARLGRSYPVKHGLIQPIRVQLLPSGNISGDVPWDGFTASGTLSIAVCLISGDTSLDAFTAGGTIAPYLGSIVTPPMKNNTGTVLINLTGVIANVYDATTGALFLRKTGLTSSSLGVVTISDQSLIPGTTYAYEIDLTVSSIGRRLPTGTVA